MIRIFTMTGLILLACVSLVIGQTTNFPDPNSKQQIKEKAARDKMQTLRQQNAKQRQQFKKAETTKSKKYKEKIDKKDKNKVKKVRQL